MLVGVTALFTLSLFSASLYRMSMQDNFSREFSSYSNIQKLEMFENAISNTKVPSNSTAYGSWLNSVYSSARIDGINATVSNGVMIISTISKPTASAIVRIS